MISPSRATKIILAASVFLASVIVARPGTQSQEANVVVSPRLAALKQAIDAGSKTALEDFWQELAKQGTPIVEPAKEDARQRLVTFIWREAKDTWVIVNNDFSKSVYQMQLMRLGTTDVWFKTMRLRDDARFLYQFSVDDPRN
jgi:Enterochelin esterase, N-terminal